jgi:hypothetical protein
MQVNLAFKQITADISMHESGEHAALFFNSNTRMLTAAVFLGIEKDYDATWHSGLLYTRKYSE